jgi:hypothetical protein
MKAPIDGMTHALKALLESDARSATVYLSPTMRVTASHVCKPGSDHLGSTVAVTYGKLNWAGRLFVDKYRRLNVPLPVNEPQLRAWPVPRKKKRRVK